MNELTSEQMSWAMEWAAKYIVDHGYQNNAVYELEYCSDMFKAIGNAELKVGEEGDEMLLQYAKPPTVELNTPDVSMITDGFESLMGGDV
jgi:hypothetical protein